LAEREDITPIKTKDLSKKLDLKMIELFKIEFFT